MLPQGVFFFIVKANVNRADLRVGAVWPSWLRERQDPRGQGFESPPEQSFAKMQTLVLAEPRDYTAESVLAPTQGSLRKS